MLQLLERLKLMGLCCWLQVECRQIGARIAINVLLVWLCQEWNQSSSSADCVNVTEMIDPNMPKRQLHSLHQCNLSQTSHFGQSFYWISSLHDAIDWNAAAAENAGYIELLYDQTLLQCKSRLRHDTPILRQQCTGGLANASKTIVQLVRESMHASMRWMMPSCLIDMTFHIHVSDWVNGIIVSSQVSLAHVAEFEMKQAVANFFSIYFTHRFAHSHGRWQSHWSCVWGCEWQWRSCWGVSVVTTTNSSRRTNNVGRATTCFTHAQNPGFPARGAWLRHIARRVNTRDSKLNEIQQQHNWFSIT